MYCPTCQRETYMAEDQQIEGGLYCIDCGHIKIPCCYLDRPSDLPNYNPPPKGGFSKDYRDDLPY